MNAFFGEQEEYKKAKFVVIPAPYDKTTSFLSGTSKAPKKIIDASYHIDTYDYELGTKSEDWFSCHTLNEITNNRDKPKEMVDKIKEKTKEVLKLKKTPVIIGGEHTVSLGGIAGTKEIYNNISVLHIDAHLDLRDEYEGERLSHACVMRRVYEIGVDVVHVGVRSLCEEEKGIIEKRKSLVFYERDYSINEILKRLGKKVYITIDADGFDPSVIPGVGTPEPNGLLWKDVQKIVKKVIFSKDVVGFDFVEVKPFEGNVVSEYLAAKMIYKMMLYKSFRKKKKNF